RTPARRRARASSNRGDAPRAARAVERGVEADGLALEPSALGVLADALHLRIGDVPGDLHLLDREVHLEIRDHPEEVTPLLCLLRREPRVGAPYLLHVARLERSRVALDGGLDEGPGILGDRWWRRRRGRRDRRWLRNGR